MYEIKCPKKYTLQLDIEDFGTRYKRLLSNNKRNKVVYIKNEFDNSTFRYRYYNFEESMRDNKKYELVCFLCDEIYHVLKNIDKVDLIVFQRTTWVDSVQNLIQIAKMKNIKLVYDIDDLIYNYNYIPDFISNVGLKCSIDNVRAYMGLAAAHEMVAKQCDAFITTTNYLKEHLEKDFSKPVYVIANYYNKEQFEISEQIIKQRKKKNDKFYIGYFSGSPSHLNDFRVCKKELIEFLKKHDNAYLKIVGFMDLDDDLIELKNNGKIIIRPLCSYQELQYEIGEVDVNIAPLNDFYFNYAKSELKFFEAAIVNVPSIVSNVGIYKEIVDNYKNAILCNQGEWFKALENLYNDKKLYKSIQKIGYDYAVDNYNSKKYTSIIEKIYDILIK